MYQSFKEYLQDDEIKFKEIWSTCGVPNFLVVSSRQGSANLHTHPGIGLTKRAGHSIEQPVILQNNRIIYIKPNVNMFTSIFLLQMMSYFAQPKANLVSFHLCTRVWNTQSVPKLIEIICGVPLSINKMEKCEHGGNAVDQQNVVSYLQIFLFVHSLRLKTITFQFILFSAFCFVVQCKKIATTYQGGGVQGFKLPYYR